MPHEDRQDAHPMGIFDAGFCIVIYHWFDLAFERILTMPPNPSPSPAPVTLVSPHSQLTSRLQHGSVHGR